MTQHRNTKGQFARKGIKWTLIITVVGAVAFFGFNGQFNTWYTKTQNQMDVVVPMKVAVAHADETDQALALKSIDQLKQDLIAKIWQSETGTYVQKDGELLITYDPTKAMIASGVCLVIGGKRPIDCDSYGPMEEKIGTIINYWPQLYGTSITQVEAFTVANDPVQAKKFFIDCSTKISGCIFNWTYANNNPVYFNIVIPIIRTAEGNS